MSVSSTVVYQVSLRPPQHELQVEMTLRGPVAQGRVKLQIPTWVPGDYSFAPQARDLFDVKARCGATGKELALRRDGWQGYVVEEGAGPLPARPSRDAFAIVVEGQDVDLGFYENFHGVEIVV